MKASFNYTGRTKLDYAKFTLNVYEGNNQVSEIGLVLNKGQIKGIGEMSSVRIEAYRGAKTMRFNLGPWRYPTDDKRFRLTDFSPGEPVLFRIKIVDEDNPGHPIVAWRDRVHPTAYDIHGAKKKSALSVTPCDLKHIAWKIDWEEPTEPELLVNTRISDAREVTSIVARDPDFAALVFPQALREILTRLLVQIPDLGADEEEDAPLNRWRVFASNLIGRWFSEDEGENPETRKERIELWVDDVVQAFGKKLNLIARYKDYKTGAKQ